jgi:hypothetical protein
MATISKNKIIDDLICVEIQQKHQKFNDEITIKIFNDGNILLKTNEGEDIVVIDQQILNKIIEASELIGIKKDNLNNK